MATLDPINVGTAPDDGTGDPIRNAFTKVNSNENILNAELITKQKAPTNRVVVNDMGDFPAPVAGKINLVANTEYYIGSNTVSILTNNIVIAPNSVISGAGGPSQLTFTGTGSMFEGGDAAFFAIRDVILDFPNGSLFNLVDTTPQTVVNIINYGILNGASLGTVDGVFAFVMDFGNVAVDLLQGISFLNFIPVISFNKAAFQSSSATFVAADLGTAISPTIEFSDFRVQAPVGAVGISGLINSGNVSSGSIATVSTCEFLGGMDALENITNDDIRWNFSGNSGIPDTNPDTLLSLTDNATETVITIVDTPVKVAGVWVDEGSSFFTGDTTGRATYLGERDLTAPVTVQNTIKASSGTNKDIKMYVAVDGVVVPSAVSANRVGQNDPRTLTIPWQVDFSENSYVEIFVENNTDTTNLIVTNSILRVR